MRVYVHIPKVRHTRTVAPTRLPKHELNKDSRRHTKANERGKAQEASSLVKNCKRLKAAEMGRNSLSREVYTTWLSSAGGQPPKPPAFRFRVRNSQ